MKERKMAKKAKLDNENVEQVAETKVVNEALPQEEIKAGESVNPNDKATTCLSNKLVVCLNYPTNLKFIVKPGTLQEHTVEFYGNANYLVGKEMGILPIGAYGLTPNVDREDWEWIKKNHKDNGLIKNGLLFAETSQKARDAAAERKDLRHGYEPKVKEEATTAEAQ